MLIGKLNAVVNFCIYIRRNEEFRKEVVSLYSQMFTYVFLKVNDVWFRRWNPKLIPDERTYKFLRYVFYLVAKTNDWASFQELEDPDPSKTSQHQLNQKKFLITLPSQQIANWYLVSIVITRLPLKDNVSGRSSISNRAFTCSKIIKNRIISLLIWKGSLYLAYTD